MSQTVQLDQIDFTFLYSIWFCFNFRKTVLLRAVFCIGISAHGRSFAYCFVCKSTTAESMCSPFKGIQCHRHLY